MVEFDDVGIVLSMRQLFTQNLMVWWFYDTKSLSDFSRNCFCRFGDRAYVTFNATSFHESVMNLVHYIRKLNLSYRMEVVRFIFFIYQ